MRNNMYYPNINRNYPQRMPYYINQNRFGGFLFPFALGFVSSPLIFGATRPRPVPMYPNQMPYYPYY